MELLKVDDHFIVSDFVSNGSFASLKENVKYKTDENYAILVRITDFVKNWNGDYIYIDEAEYNFLNKSKVFPGDLIVSNVGQPGLAFLLPNLNIKTSLAPNALFVRPKSYRVNNTYLYYYLKTPQAQKIIDSICTKTTLKKFNKTSFRNLILPFPSYENQLRIGNLLEKIQETMAVLKDVIALIDEFISSAFHEMFNEKNKIKDISLADLAKKEDHSLSSGPFGSYLTSQDYVKDGVVVLRGKNITNGRLNLNDIKYISVEKAEELKRSRLKPDDVVIVAVGSSGNALRIPTGFPEAIMSQNFNKITPNKKLVDPTFLAYVINSELVQKQFRDVITNGGRTFLGLSRIKNVLIPYFDVNLQRQFANVVEKMDIIKKTQEAQLLDLEELYAQVSNKAFSEELNLSKIPYNKDLLPKEIANSATSYENLNKATAEIYDHSKGKSIKPTKKKPLLWENVSFKEVSDYIREEYGGYYFNSEMLLNYLTERIGISVNYFLSSEQKKNPKYENADDFYKFIVISLSGENRYLELEQVFYNAEEKNIDGINFTKEDFATVMNKTDKQRSGIYFRIKDEINTR